MSEIYDFMIPANADYKVADLSIKINMQGQQGDFFVNGKNRWHFGLLLEADDPRMVGMPTGFNYSEDWSKYLKSGENALEYIPLRQVGARDEQQKVNLVFLAADGAILYEVSWKSSDLIDGEKKVIRFLIQETGVEENSEPETQTSDITVEKHTFGN